jgi:hypothetical protein
MKNSMKTLTFLMVLAPIVASANAPGTLVCRDSNQNVVVSTGIPHGKSELELVINSSSGLEHYSIKNPRPGVYTGHNGLRAQVPELDLSQGLQKASFKYDENDRASKAVQVKCKDNSGVYER